MTPDDLIGLASETWRHCEGTQEMTLLRLAVLRDLVRSLHAEKSRCLASGKKGDVQSIRVWESRIDALRNASPLDGELLELLSGTKEIRKRTRLLPNELFSVIERDKLERYDRLWEAALAAEASALGWQIWSLEIDLQVQEIESWDKNIREKLWPYGIVLFVENAKAPASESFWRGRWTVVLHPRFKNAQDLSLDLKSMDPKKSQPQWKPLFSPKNR